MSLTTAAAGVLIALTVTGAPVPLDEPDPDLPTGPNDPACLQFPGYAACQGGPYWQGPPTGPLDPQCSAMPGDAACVGSPFTPPAPPPPPPAPMPPPPMPHMPEMPGHI
ncbi:hypothetical protein ACRDU6_25740 [Mycolicibacterium sp. ELW1]|uniref:hypothetical protein n=1 Tax=Mycobacteriaceae TaxID=1762 RepID=UPI0011EF8DE6|nr:hypothetical protein [Mycobacterium sp. ELW1]QEN15637.1 hypothetical protein D3H54_22260 [Mycobacterium sp. ELW1]